MAKTRKSKTRRSPLTLKTFVQDSYAVGGNTPLLRSYNKKAWKDAAVGLGGFAAGITGTVGLAYLLSKGSTAGQLYKTLPVTAQLGGIGGGIGAVALRKKYKSKKSNITKAEWNATANRRWEYYNKFFNKK
jgi:hypothetical protein